MLAEARQVEAHHPRQVRRIGAELVEPVALHVVRHPAVPVGQVDRQVVAHQYMIAELPSAW